MLISTYIHVVWLLSLNTDLSRRTTPQSLLYFIIVLSRWYVTLKLHYLETRYRHLFNFRQLFDWYNRERSVCENDVIKYRSRISETIRYLFIAFPLYLATRPALLSLLDLSGLKVPDDWPGKGEIVFENVSLRYNADRNPTIVDLSLKIPAGQKVIEVIQSLYWEINRQKYI